MLVHIIACTSALIYSPQIQEFVTQLKIEDSSSFWSSVHDGEHFIIIRNKGYEIKLPKSLCSLTTVLKEKDK